MAKVSRTPTATVIPCSANPQKSENDGHMSLRLWKCQAVYDNQYQVPTYIEVFLKFPLKFFL